VALGTVSIANAAALRPSTGMGLDAFFSPKNVAVIGATDKQGSVGRTVSLNLTSGQPYQPF
jgi:hypothetical protein